MGDVMFRSLGRQIGKTWRSIFAIVLAYVMVAALFFWAPNLLDSAINQSHGFHDWLANLIGRFSSRGRILFFSTITDFATFMTLVILFMRVVVITLALWISEAVTGGIFGRE
jgi:hypothetical protein